MSSEAFLAQDGDRLKALLREEMQELLEGEMAELLGAAPGYRAATTAAAW